MMTSSYIPQVDGDFVLLTLPKTEMMPAHWLPWPGPRFNTSVSVFTPTGIPEGASQYAHQGNANCLKFFDEDNYQLYTIHGYLWSKDNRPAMTMIYGEVWNCKVEKWTVEIVLPWYDEFKHLTNSNKDVIIADK